MFAEDIPLPEYEDYDVAYEKLGCDVIGWDMGGFHSFLCNSLQELFADLCFTENGLADVSYAEAEKMADKIIEDGRGEPVEWLPVTIDMILL